MKRFWTRLGLLTVLVMGGQLLVGRLNVFWDSDELKHGFLSRNVQSPAEVVFLGDCVLGWTAADDRDIRGIPEMLQELILPRTVARYPQPGADLDVSDALVTRFVRQDQRPRLIVIPINLRALSPGWDRAPEYQFRSLKFRLRYGDFVSDTFLAPLAALKVYPLNPISAQEYANTPVFDGTVQIGTLKDFRSSAPQPPGDRLRRAFVVNYGTPLSTDHPKLNCLESITKRCRRVGIEPVFYVSPVDLESGVEAAGPSLQATAIRNVQIIRDRLSGIGLPLLDLSREVDAAGFDWKRSGLPNERLSERGRRIVADRVAKILPR